MPVPLILGIMVGICALGTIRCWGESPAIAAVFSWAGGFNLSLFLHSIGA